ncbi:MAG: hypothetical protein KDC88_12235 [Ignavibacteriae bacterium]|nr:hypothetical protein [Ignavibacteriota bacterium]
MKILFLIILFICSVLFAQVNPSVSNLLRYGNGKQSIGDLNNDFQYFENLTDFRLGLPQNFNLGFRLLYDDPPEIGERFKGIQKRFIEFSDGNVNVRVGNSSELYGRGLVLNLFENRGLAYDTWLDGIKAIYKIDDLKASIIAGEINFRDSVTITRFEKYKIRGGNFEYRLFEPLKLGTSFIYAESVIPQFDGNKLNAVSELPEVYFDLNSEKFSWFLSFASKWTNTVSFKKSKNGNGLYSSFSFAHKSFGITLEYKNYNFDEQNPYLQNDETRTTKFLPFQNPPIVMKEHSYVFLSRSLHQVDFNDEVGFQIDANYSANEDLNFNFNFSLASRHNFYALNNNFTFQKEIRNTNFLPTFDEKYSPYLEFFSEGEYYFDLYTAFRFGIAYREKTIYNYFTGKSGNHVISSFIIPLQFQHTFSTNFSSLFQYEFENVEDNYNSEQPNFNNHFFSILASIYRKISFAIRYELTSNNFDVSGRKDWFLSEVGYRISGANLITFSYGREKGGQVCTNGVCRYLLPFKGFRLSFQTNI